MREEEELARKKAGSNRASATQATIAAANKAREEDERYRAQQVAYDQQQAAAARAQQQQQTISYTPPDVGEDEFDPFLFIKNLPPLSPAMRNRRSPLPKKSLKAPPITLALDLDETLVGALTTNTYIYLEIADRNV